MDAVRAVCYLLRYKRLLESVAAGHRDVYGRSVTTEEERLWSERTLKVFVHLSIRHFLFGFMEGNDYINGIVMRCVCAPGASWSGPGPLPVSRDPGGPCGPAEVLLSLLWTLVLTGS